MARRTRYKNKKEIRPDIVKRIVLYGVLLLFLAAIQCSFFARLQFLPATPDLILCAVLGILLLDCDSAAFIAAVTGGLMLDAVGGLGVAWSPLFYLAVTAVMSLTVKKVMPGLASFLVLLLPSLLFRVGFTALFVWKSGILSSVSVVAKKILLPEAIVTFFCGFVVYALVCLFRLPIRDGRNRSRRSL